MAISDTSSSSTSVNIVNLQDGRAALMVILGVNETGWDDGDDGDGGTDECNNHDGDNERWQQ